MAPTGASEAVPQDPALRQRPGGRARTPAQRFAGLRVEEVQVLDVDDEGDALVRRDGAVGGHARHGVGPVALPISPPGAFGVLVLAGEQRVRRRERAARCGSDELLPSRALDEVDGPRQAPLPALAARRGRREVFGPDPDDDRASR